MMELTTEVVGGLVYLFMLRRFPRFIGLISLLIAVAIGYTFNRSFGIGGVGTVNGANITGEQYMHAAIYDGSAEGGVRMANISVPDHTQSQVLIRVRAAALNPTNYKLVVAYMPFFRHLKTYVIGYDVSGIVLSKGADSACAHFKVNDEVYGMAASGSLAQYATLSCEKAAKKPKTLTHEQASGLPIVAVTTLQALEYANVTRNKNVLVVGASGGCGIFGVKIAKALGAKVTGICSTRNVEFVKSLGADAVVDYTNKNNMSKLQSDGRVFDAVYDTVSSFDPVDPDYEPIARPTLREGGIYVAINGAVADWFRTLFAPLFKKFGVDLERPGYKLLLANINREVLERIADMFDRGLLKQVPIDLQLKLDSDAALRNAWSRMQSRRAKGKIVLTL